jgi:hypothetical protein
MLGVPFWARPAHIVPIGPVGGAEAAPGGLPDFAKSFGEITPHYTLPSSFAAAIPFGASLSFSNACLSRIVGEKSLKFVAISTEAGSNCDQTLRGFNGNPAAEVSQSGDGRMWRIALWRVRQGTLDKIGPCRPGAASLHQRQIFPK